MLRTSAPRAPIVPASGIRGDTARASAGSWRWRRERYRPVARALGTAVEIIELGRPRQLTGAQVPRPDADLSRIEGALKQFQSGRARRRCFANTTVGGFKLVLYFRHFHIHDATILIWVQRSLGRSFRFVIGRILVRGSLESSAGSIRSLSAESRRAAAGQHQGASCSFSARPRPLGSDREPITVEVPENLDISN